MSGSFVARIEKSRYTLQESKQLLQSSRGNTPKMPEDAYARADEATTRMHQEMIGNLDDIDKMRLANALNGPFPSVTAMLEWLYMVGPWNDGGLKGLLPGGAWNHKPMLREELGFDREEEPGEGFYFPIDPNSPDEYNYDIWSNIHYGYIGSAAGFTPFELREGADAADGFKRMPADDLSVRIGIELWEKHGSNLTEEQLRQAIIDHTDDYKQAQTEENPAVVTPEDPEWNGR